MICIVVINISDCIYIFLRSSTLQGKSGRSPKRHNIPFTCLNTCEWDTINCVSFIIQKYAEQVAFVPISLISEFITVRNISQPPLWSSFPLILRLLIHTSPSEEVLFVERNPFRTVQENHLDVQWLYKGASSLYVCSRGLSSWSKAVSTRKWKNDKEVQEK